MSNYFRWNAGRKRQGTPTLESQPGAHTGATRKYIPGYSDSNIIFLNTSTGSDALDGTSIANAKLTYASAATAAGTTKKIRLVNSATLTSNITKPTEATIGTTSTIASASMTAPVDTWTQAGTPSFGTSTVQSVTWSPKLSKYLAVASSAAKAAYSTDGNTWVQSSAPSFVGQEVAWCDYLDIGVYCGTGNIGTTNDGITYATVLTDSLNPLYNSIAVSNDLRCIVVAGNSQAAGQLGARYAYSVDAVTWETGFIIPFGNDYVLSIAYSHPLQRFIVGGNNGKLAYSDDGRTWTTPTTNPISTGTQVVGITYCSSIGKYVAVCLDSTIAYSADGDTWTMAATPAFVADLPTCVSHSDELGIFVAASDTGDIAYSTDGNTWTIAATPSYGGTNISGICYSPLLGKFVTVGQSGKIAYSTAYATTISAYVAGFSIQAVQYSGTVTAYNCTLKQPGTTAALSLDSCRVTESGGHISNNAVTAIATLVEGDIHYTGVYAAANALDLNLNTIAGTLYIYNGSTTNYERIRDNIIGNGVRTSYPVTVTSGNTRGTSSDGTIFGQFCTTSDPLFVNKTDYKLQRVLDGYQYDSPMVAASQYYYNQATTQTFRDNGAWSYNEGSATYKYQRTFNFLMPATAIGSAIDFVRHNRANLHVAEDGTPDAVNTPDSRWEEIVMQFKTLPADHIDFINWLEGKVDMTCDISLSPSLTPTTAVTASGATAAGEAVITITDNSGLDSGDQLTIDGNTYTVLYTYGTTKVVLDRVTTTALSDTESITVKYDTGFGEYQYVPMLERRLSRWYETDENYMRGLQIRFARKLP